MRATLKSLKDYQEVLIRIAELDRLLSEVPPDIATLEQEWQTIKQRVKDLDTRKQEQETKLKELAISLEEANIQSQKFEKDLHEVTNTKEYNAVLKEIDSAKKLVHSHTEDIDSRKADLEEIARNTEECTVLEKESRGLYRKAVRKHKGTLTENEKELKTRQTEKAKVAKGVPEKLMHKFDRIAARRNGVGLALCISAVCRSCNVRVRQNVVDELRKFTRLISCESCKRILFFADGDE